METARRMEEIKKKVEQNEEKKGSENVQASITAFMSQCELRAKIEYFICRQ